MSAECVIRFSNFKIRGTFHSSVLLFTSSDNEDIVRLTNGVHADTVTLCVGNLLKAILRILKLDQYARSVPANVLNIQIVVCGCTLKDSQQVHWLGYYHTPYVRADSFQKRLVADIMQIICNNQHLAAQQRHHHYNRAQVFVYMLLAVILNQDNLTLSTI